MKWQDVAVILFTMMLLAGGVTYSDLFGALFELNGVESTFTGDQLCGDTCESYINVTTSYWRVCFEHTSDDQRMYIPGDSKLSKVPYYDYPETVLYKKANYGRTLWVNLNNVDNVVSTAPNVPVDWLVPTYGNNWRPIEDGDCWDRGKVNKIKLVGHKKETQDVKWSFVAGEYVDIDPLWEGLNVTYTPSSRTECSDGVCNALLYSHTQYVEEDDGWVHISDARSLAGAGYDIHYLEVDEDFSFEVIDFNMTSMEIQGVFTGDPLDYPDFCTVKTPNVEFKCQFKNSVKYDELVDGEMVEQTVKYDVKYEMKNGEIVADTTKFTYTGDPFSKEFVFGGNSTRLILNVTDSNIIYDTVVYSGAPTTYYGTSTTMRMGATFAGADVRWWDYIMYDISDIPDSVTVEDAQLHLSATFGYTGYYVYGYHVYDWRSTSSGNRLNETNLAWANMPCGTSWTNSTYCNLTYEDYHLLTIDPITLNFTNAINYELDASNDNVSFALRDNQAAFTVDKYVDLATKEYATASYVHYLNLTYSYNGDNPRWSDNQTDSTSAGAEVTFSVFWNSTDDYDSQMDSYIFGWHNGTNWTLSDITSDLESSTKTYTGASDGSGGGTTYSTWDDSSGDSVIQDTYCYYQYGEYALLNITDLLDNTSSDIEEARLYLYFDSTGTDPPDSSNIWRVLNTSSWTEAGTDCTTLTGYSVQNRSYRADTWNGAINNWDYGDITAVIKDALDNDLDYVTILHKLSNGSSTQTSKGGTASWRAGLDSGGDSLRKEFKDRTETPNVPYLWINISTSSSVPDEDSNKTAVEYSNIDTTVYEVVEGINVTVYVSDYNTSGSIDNANTNVTLWLEVYNGTDWVDEGDIGTGTTQTTGNYSVYVDTASVLTGWETVANRDVRVSVRYLDYSDATNYDNISWTNVWVEVDSQQFYLNDSAVSFTAAMCVIENETCWSNVTKSISTTVGNNISWYIWANTTVPTKENTTDVFLFEVTTSDTCSYTSGDWNVDCSDDCSITSAVDVGGNDIFITGTGTFTTDSDISNFGTVHIEGTDSSNTCDVTCDGGCFVK